MIPLCAVHFIGSSHSQTRVTAAGRLDRLKLCWLDRSVLAASVFDDDAIGAGNRDNRDGFLVDDPRRSWSDHLVADSGKIGLFHGSSRC